MNALYNEVDPYAAQWLRNLVEHGHVAPGRVEQRSIADLRPRDVTGPGQRHFFAGIGGWSYALRLAGIADDADIWTGSCPCQPFSDAGKGLGVRDPRHLWPVWFELIRECRPATIFGEQVASREGLAWLDVVRSDLEGCGYAFGASDLCAAGVGAPHIRQRLYFVANANRKRRGLSVRPRRIEDPETGESCAARTATDCELVDASGSRSGRHTGAVSDVEAQGEGERREPLRVADEPVDAGAACPCEGDYCTNPKCDWPDDHNGRVRTTGRRPIGICDCGHDAADHDGREDCGRCSCTFFVGDAACDELAGSAECRRMATSQVESTPGLDGDHRTEHAGASRRLADGAEQGRARAASRQERRGESRTRADRENDPWSDADWLPCTDGVSRPVEPGTFPLAHGVSGRVVVLRSIESADAEIKEEEHWYNRTGALAGFGNAIVPQVAAVFIEAALAARGDLK